MAELLRVRHLVKHFPVRRGLLGGRREYVHAVDDISFSLGVNQTLGLVGESGCGKSTAGLSILRLIEPTSGEVWFQGRNILQADPAEDRRLRREMQIVFQDPFGSLNPRLTLERIVEEPLLNHRRLTREERRELVGRTLALVGLLPEHMDRFPHEFSGGQRQRICIARALVLRPRLVVGDEPISALDVSVQAQILNLLGRLQRRLELSFLFISHDLAVVRYLCHRVAVMYLGKIVEMGEVDLIYGNPLHPYTRALLSAAPVPDPRKIRRRTILTGDVPSPINPPPGCRFHPRCPERTDLCSKTLPRSRQVENGHMVVCHLHQTGPEWRPEEQAATPESSPDIS